jgi:hypothetical protein
MAPKRAFDPHTFLAIVGTGRTIVAYHAQRPIFSQGEVANASSISRPGRSSSLSSPSRAREP